MNGDPSGVQFDIGKLVGRAWEAFTKNVPAMVGGFAIIAAVGIAIQFLIPIPIVNLLVGWVITGPLALGYYAAALRCARGETAAIGDIFNGFQRFLPAAMAMVLISIATTIGAVLCILPGLFIALLYMLTYLFMHDNTLDFWPAMERSRTAVMANLGQWLLVFLTFVILIIVGIVLFGVGVLVTGPLAVLVVAAAYEQVYGAGGPSPDGAEPLIEA